MTSTSLRILGAILLGLTLLTGVYLSGKARRDVDKRVADLHEGVGQSEQAAAARDEPPLPSLELHPEQFQMRLDEDLARFGLAAVTLEQLRQPNAYFDELSDPVTLTPGKTWSSPHVRIKAYLDRVSYLQHGAKVNSVHTLARVENVSKVAIAYRLALRGEDGKCEVRGAREHNAVALRPGESAEIVVCAGKHDVRIEALEVLEVTDLGYHYVSQLSPSALGQDATNAAAHKPMVSVSACAQLDVKSLLAYQRAGTASWADVVDFYSRHDCHRLQFFPGYRRAEEPLAALPVAPPR